MESKLEDLRRMKEEGDRRLWQFSLLFFGGLITLAVQIALLFLRGK